MPRRKTRYTRSELEERLDTEIPGITENFPSNSKFKFWIDNTPQQNEYVEVGSSFGGAMRVCFGDKTGNKMLFFNIGARYPEKIIHENKELARIKTKYSAPFNRVSALRYEYPGSSFAESLQWFTELRALTMFVFVWCGRRAEFFDFNKGEGFEVLVEVLKRSPEVVVNKTKDDFSDNKEDDLADESLAENTDADPGTHADAEGGIDMPVAELPTGEQNGSGPTITPMCPILKKRTHQEFAEGQQD
ncbi:uncharacterized protein N0V89_007126 [Didymosphaeria variabile]|uniref:Uncharacterized protein n=1 Tax=Didymosphaeria variabile TaxID=1932322 RepID=A0A9W8XKH0_9PLEO|nr:uncharacterized protein N0V89_007126 [Didymosphaeria variabile]KAJ4351783.1 hypothetical protein N0V89_007126 [Didymosphaeria variabile]